MVLCASLDLPFAHSRFCSTEGLDNVVPRFHTIGTDKTLVKDHFYTFNYGKELTLKDSLMGFSEQQFQELEEEFVAMEFIRRRIYNQSEEFYTC